MSCKSSSKASFSGIGGNFGTVSISPPLNGACSCKIGTDLKLCFSSSCVPKIVFILTASLGSGLSRAKVGSKG